MTEPRKPSLSRAQEVLESLSKNMEGLRAGLRRRHAKESVAPEVLPSLPVPPAPAEAAFSDENHLLPAPVQDLAGPLPSPTPDFSLVMEEEVLSTSAHDVDSREIEPLDPALLPLPAEPGPRESLGSSVEGRGEASVLPAEKSAPSWPPLPEVFPSAVSDSHALSEPEWLADLELTEGQEQSSAEGVVSVGEDDLEDRLDLTFSSVVQEEIEELIPAIEGCLATVATKKRGVAAELHRLVHTLKGVAGMAGAMRTRAMIHSMETIMEEVNEGRVLDSAMLSRLEDMFARVKVNLSGLFRPSSVDEEAGAVVPAQRSVRVSADLLERLFNEINEARLAGTALGGGTVSMRKKLRELDENIARVSRMSRDLEIQAETQIQSRRAQLAENNEEFDPLEFDRFTLLQELSRLLTEAVSDVQDLQRDMARSVSEQETSLAYQERSIHEVQEGLQKTRLVSVDLTINDRLHKVALSAAREMGKSVSFSLSGGGVALDRAMLDKIANPLDHLLRNSVAHGIEMPSVRQERGKPVSGQLRVAVEQEAGRVLFVVEDDGEGLNVDRIRSKAIEKGLWQADRTMSDKQAADMICLPGFSTADGVSQIAGRGVGMDVVRSDVLSMGGRFDLASRPGRGLRVAISLPTTVSTASVMVVEAGGETWSIPIETIDDITVLRDAALEEARQSGTRVSAGTSIPFASLDVLMGVRDASTIPQSSAPVLLLREGERRVAVEVGKLKQVAEVPIRPLGRLWAFASGIVGSTLLPDGRASFLVDPLRAPWETARLASEGAEREEEAATLLRAPLILVVDDSITVRKVTAKFLERNGFEPVLAKDGQEALEILAQIQPAAMLLDVEMPRMDGFDCAKNVRENPRHRDLPILMITSRTADKHRDRAMALGVDEYMGKPFREEELLAQLRHYVANGRRPH